MKEAVDGALDSCVKCGICTANCPVASFSFEFSGPKHMGPDLTRFRLDNKIPLEGQVDYCCNCKNCEVVCPSGVKVSLLNAYYKSQWKLIERDCNPRDKILARPHYLAKLGSFNVGLSNLMLDQGYVKGLLEKTLKVSRHRPLPAYQKESVIKWFNKGKSITSDKKVIYFLGCYTNYNETEIGKNVVRILERNGFEVMIPKQSCCGLPLMANGYLDAAIEQGRKNLASLLPLVKQGYKVVTSCSSCSLTLKSEYQELFGLAEAKQLAPFVYEFGEFLRELFEEHALKTNFKPLKKRVAYHAPCHLKVQGIGRPSVDILRLIPGFEIIDIGASCCGISGSYGFKKEKYEISMKVGQELFNKISEVSPDYVLTECGTCALQIRHGTGKEVINLPTIMAQAYES